MSWNNSKKPNDPWGGQQYPDFEAFVEKIRGMFGGGGGGLPKFPVRAFSGLISVGVAAWAASGFYQIENAERGVVTRFGKFVHETSEGLNWHLPYPVENVEIVNVQRVRTEEIGFRQQSNTKVLSEALMLTQDENIVDVQLIVQYRINSASSFLFNVRDPTITLRQVTESALREVVGRSSMDDVLTGGREQVVQDVKRLVQKTLDDYGTGLQIDTVNMSDASAPQQVQAAFNDAVKAREDKERFVNEAQAYANQILPLARGEAARIEEEALAYRERTVAEAQGQADRFTSIADEYRKAPVITRDRMYLQALEQVMLNSSKIIIDTEGGNNILYLPLDQLVKQSGGNAAAALTGGGVGDNRGESALSRGRTAVGNARNQLQNLRDNLRGRSQR